ncbi:MAG TPA: DNA polymerase III subunit alpha, partial [Rhodospirillales bacterium]|nr:DNA polymerase III subunit alpha [Rhodospirillales bacterium]
VVALYRPGPMENIPSYIARKHGHEEPDYLYPTLEGILKETFGIMIYQEQVMQVAQELSGYSLGNADLLRRAMGKKDQAGMDKERQNFIEGAKARGVPDAKASQIFDQVNLFAGYGFNKSHAAAYAMVAYQTAYLKANYPLEFLAASMTLDINNTDKLNQFRQELARLGFVVHGPDVNASQVEFTVAGDAVRYGLAAIRNVGEGAMVAFTGERDENGPFADIADFADRIDTRNMNKRQLENLVRAGAFDSLEGNRRKVFSGVEAILRHASAAAQDRNSDQIGLFGGDTAPKTTIPMDDVADWSPMDRMKEEFDAVGFYLSGHPLDSYGQSLNRIKARSSAEIIAEGESGAVKLAGTVIAKKERMSAKGKRFAFVQLSDASGAFEVMVFSELLNSARELLQVGQNLLIKGSVQFEGETPRFTANSFELLDRVAAQATPGLRLVIGGSDKSIPTLLDALSVERGQGKISIIARPEEGLQVEINLQNTLAITPELLRSLREISGIEDIQEI